MLFIMSFFNEEVRSFAFFTPFRYPIIYPASTKLVAIIPITNHEKVFVMKSNKLII